MVSVTSCAFTENDENTTRDDMISLVFICLSGGLYIYRMWLFDWG